MHEAELASVAVARCQGPNSGEAGSGHRNFRGLKVAHNFDRRTSRRPMIFVFTFENDIDCLGIGNVLLAADALCQVHFTAMRL